MKIMRALPNCKIVDEQYNILHSSKGQSKISFLEIRQFAKNSNDNNKKRIMLYIFWLTLYTKNYNIENILYQYNISKNEYEEFQKEKIEKINHQIEYYISNKRMSNGVCSFDLFENLKKNNNLQEFVSKNKYVFHKFTETIRNDNNMNQYINIWLNAMKNIWM
jgi:hypothetical protein